MPLTLAEQVDKQVAKVRQGHSAAVSALKAKFFQTDQTKAHISALNSLLPTINDWAARGAAAAKRDDVPGPKGWPGWVDAGEVILKGIDEIHELGDGATLDDVVYTAKNIPKNAPADLKKGAQVAAKAAADAGAAVGGAVGGTAFALLRPFLPWVIVAGVGVAAVYFGPRYIPALAKAAKGSGRKGRK